MRSRVRGGRRGIAVGAVALLAVMVLVPAPWTAAAGYDPGPFCQFHVMGSLFGDGGGNGPANGAAWNPSNTNWKLSNSNANVIGRFERCARLMVADDIGGNGTATVTRRNNSVELAGFWPAGRLVAFSHDVMTDLVAQATPLQRRAFLMSVIEGEGEVCDPANGPCGTAQIADNSRSTSGGTNPDFSLHIVALVPVAIDAGLVSAYTAAAQGCVPRSGADLAAGSGAALCIRSSDFAVIRGWPVASCKRVPGYGSLPGYACGQADAPTGPPPPTTVGGTPTIQGFGSVPDPIPAGGPGALWWQTVGMDANRCKVRAGAEVLGTNLPASSTGWPLPSSRVRDGAVFTLVCFAGSAKFSSSATIAVG